MSLRRKAFYLPVAIKALDDDRVMDLVAQRGCITRLVLDELFARARTRSDPSALKATFRERFEWDLDKISDLIQIWKGPMWPVPVSA